MAPRYSPAAALILHLVASASASSWSIPSPQDLALHSGINLSLPFPSSGGLNPISPPLQSPGWGGPVQLTTTTPAPETSTTGWPATEETTTSGWPASTTTTLAPEITTTGWPGRVTGWGSPTTTSPVTETTTGWPATEVTTTTPGWSVETTTTLPPQTTTVGWSIPTTTPGWIPTTTPGWNPTTPGWIPTTSGWAPTLPPSSGWSSSPSEVEIAMEGEAAVVGVGVAGASHASNTIVIGNNTNPATLLVSTGSYATVGQEADVLQASSIDPTTGESSTVQLVAASNFVDSGEYFQGEVIGNQISLENDGSSFAIGEGAIGLAAITVNESSP